MSLFRIMVYSKWLSFRRSNESWWVNTLSMTRNYAHLWFCLSLSTTACNDTCTWSVSRTAQPCVIHFRSGWVTLMINMSSRTAKKYASHNTLISNRRVIITRNNFFVWCIAKIWTRETRFGSWSFYFRLVMIHLLSGVKSSSRNIHRLLKTIFLWVVINVPIFKIWTSASNRIRNVFYCCTLCFLCLLLSWLSEDNDFIIDKQVRLHFRNITREKEDTEYKI